MNHDEAEVLFERRLSVALKNQPGEWTGDCIPPERILELVDRSIPEPEAAAMMAHVALCSRCRREFSETVELVQLADEVGALEAAAPGVRTESARTPQTTSEWEAGSRPLVRRRSFWDALFAPGLGFAMGSAAAAAILFLAVVQPAQLQRERLNSDIRSHALELARANNEKLSAEQELAKLKQQSQGASTQLASKMKQLSDRIKAQEIQIARLDDAAGALEQIPLPAPDWLPRRTGGQLRGGTSEPDPSVLIPLAGPVNTAVENRRPVLEIRALAGAANYRFTLELADATEVAPALRQLSPTRWQPVEPLKPGELYQWSVTAQRGGESVRSALAKFYVLSDAEQQELESERKRSGGSSLALGALYARLGMMDAAAREFQAILKQDPNNSVARRWLVEIPKRGIEE